MIKPSKKMGSCYPFSLKHKGYNNQVSANANGVASNYKTYQGQEHTEDLGLNFHEWKYRVSDPTIGRFWQIDPLAEKYVYNGTYNFAENRVIDGNELEGLEWVDANGNKVYDPNIENEDGTRGGYTDYATTDHKNLGKSLNTTETGREQFNSLVNSDVPTTTVIDRENARTTEDGGLILGVTKVNISPSGNVGVERDENGNMTGLKPESFEITFYEKNIDQVSDDLNDNDPNTGGDAYGKVVPEGTTYSQIFGIVFGHEIGHTDPANLLYEHKGGDPEDRPTEISNKIIDEIKKKK